MTRGLPRAFTKLALRGYIPPPLGRPCTGLGCVGTRENGCEVSSNDAPTHHALTRLLPRLAVAHRHRTVPSGQSVRFLVGTVAV
jgi:hypothetical protein